MEASDAPFMAQLKRPVWEYPSVPKGVMEWRRFLAMVVAMVGPLGDFPNVQERRGWPARAHQPRPAAAGLDLLADMGRAWIEGLGEIRG